MSEKLPLLIAYSVVGLLLALWPLWPLLGGRLPTLRRSSDSGHTQGSRSLRRLPVGIGIGLIISSVLPWWRNDRGFGFIPSWGEALAFLVLGSVALVGVLSKKKSSPVGKAAVRPFDVAFVVSALALSFTTLSFLNQDGLFSAWHHWALTSGRPSWCWQVPERCAIFRSSMV